MSYPKLKINTQKMRDNLNFLSKKLKDEKLTLTAITKVFSAHDEMIQLYDTCPDVAYLGDSRIQNLKKYQHATKKKILIRIPMLSEVSEVVRYADISFNSSLKTVQKLNEAAREQNKIHKVLLMVDLGDLREGYYSQTELIHDLEKMKTLSNIKVMGIGVNLTCYGAIIPDENNLGKLVVYKEKMEKTLGYSLEMVSGGNSSSLYLMEDGLPKGINNLRVGEALVLGRETAYGNVIQEMHQDVFELEVELVEVKEKPSMPEGNIGMNAFGETPVYEDKGIMKRGVLAIGKQDVSESAIFPIDSEINILGASSDHLLVDLTHASTNYQLGDKLTFSIEYGSLLSLYTSEYVAKEYV